MKQLHILTILILILLLVACGPIPTPKLPTFPPGEASPTLISPGIPIGTSVPADTSTPIETNTASITLTPTPLTGKPIGSVQSFSIVDNYDPSGLMGDIGDINIAKQGEAIRFNYETQGRGDHEWDYKYKSCALNLDPSRFGGVMLLDPPSNWGIIEGGGYDLRGFKTIKWDAISLSGDTYVEFLIGGVRWQWILDKGTNCWIKADVPYPDSMPRISLGSRLLTSQSQSFQYQLSNIPEEYLRDVLGGFGWTISWAPNGVELDAMATPPGPLQAKTIVVEVSNIRYVK